MPSMSQPTTPQPVRGWKAAVLPAAILALLASLMSGLVTDGSSWAPAGLLVAGVLLLIAELAMSWRSVSLAIFQRSTVYSLNSAVQVGVVFLILLMVNHLAWRKSERSWWMPKFDLTAQGFHTFSPQTDAVLERLSRRKTPVKVTAFLLDPQGSSPQERALRRQRLEVTQLLERYAQKSERFAYKLVDPEVDPILTRNSGVTVPGTIFFETEDRKLEVVSGELFTGNPTFNQPRRFKGEQVFTSKLLDLLESTKRTLYFLTGHLEGDVDKDGPEGLSHLKQRLEADNVAVHELNLLITPEVPDDCSVLVLAGPRRDLVDPELAAVRRYLDQRRAFMVLIEPSPYLHGVAGLLAEYGVRTSENVVIEPSGKHSLSGRPTMAIPDLNGHAITDPLIENGLRVVFNVATALDHSDAARSGVVDVRTIMQSSPDAWGETDLTASAGGVAKDAGDVQPPLSLAFAVSSRPGSNDGTHQRPETELRLVVHGDGDYVNNGNLSYPGNFDFFANSFHWLTRDTDRITIRPKEVAEQRADIPKEVEGRLWFGLTFGLPLIFMAMGFSIWWSRRAM